MNYLTDSFNGVWQTLSVGMFSIPPFAWLSKNYFTSTFWHIRAPAIRHRITDMEEKDDDEAPKLCKHNNITARSLAKEKELLLWRLTASCYSFSGFSFLPPFIFLFLLFLSLYIPCIAATSVGKAALKELYVCAPSKIGVVKRDRKIDCFQTLFLCWRVTLMMPRSKFCIRLPTLFLLFLMFK